MDNGKNTKQKLDELLDRIKAITLGKENAENGDLVYGVISGDDRSLIRFQQYRAQPNKLRKL